MPAGSIVVWTRAGTHTHTVAADDGSFDSGLLRGADPFRRTFDTAGVYAYYCDVHGGPGGVAMSGTVIVKMTAGDRHSQPAFGEMRPDVRPGAPTLQERRTFPMIEG